MIPVRCPACGVQAHVDPDAIDDGIITCDNCNEVLSVDALERWDEDE